VLMDAPRPLASLRSNVPGPLARAVERCLEKDPQARFQSVAELALALQPFAPEDSRELATRIARIGAGARGVLIASSPSSESSKPVASGTNANWAHGTTSRPAARSRMLVLAGLGCVAMLAAVAVALAHKPHIVVASDPTPTSAVPTLSAAPVVLAPEPPPPVSAVAVASSAAAVPRAPAVKAAPPRPVRVKGDAQSPATPTDTPQYRTTW
jgi:hypothetical protein